MGKDSGKDRSGNAAKPGRAGRGKLPKAIYEVELFRLQTEFV